MRDKNNKKRSLLLILLLLVVGISIGYAALATTLNINGNTTIEKALWDIHFENLVKTTGSETATVDAAIDSTKTLIEYTVTLPKPGDFYEFTVDMVNAGTIDAMISEVLKEGLTTDQEKYIEYSATYSDGVKLEEKDYLKSGETQNIKVRVKYRDDINADELPTENQSLSLKFMVTYIQADDTAKDRNKLINIISQEEEGKLLPGDEIAISTEHFYVVSSNENETVMLAKYNLLVGNIVNYNPAPTNTLIEDTTEGYGLQSEIAKGYIGSNSGITGVTIFSPTSYWLVSPYSPAQGLKEQYPGSINGPDYPDVYDSNSSVYTYVEDYKTRLQKLGANVDEARLLTYVEAINLGCDFTNNTCTNVSEKNKFVYSSSYWLGTYVGGVLTIRNSGMMGEEACNYPYSSGVRPVIVLNTSDILS